MICTYIRSSALGSYDYCPMSHFINYNLGIQQVPRVKTVIGTTAHKVLECLAICKKYIQDNPRAKKIMFTDDALGELTISKSKLFEESILTPLEITKINSSRINKDVYMHPVFLEQGAKRIGREVVDDLIARTIKVYKDDRWAPIDEKHASNFVWMALEWDNGQFDPRNRNIFFPEKQFDFVLDRDWSSYEFEMNGEMYRGNLAIKGTIDLITKVNDTTLEIIDWKTGQRKDWGTDKIKDYDYFCQDRQLMLYYYAARKMFPQFDNIFVTIFYIRHSGPFTVCFDTSHMDQIELTLKQHFLEVSANTKPKMRSERQTDFQCKILCDYFKKKVGNTNFCKHIHNELNTIGMDAVIEQYKAPDFDPCRYQAPGEVKE